MTAAEIRPRSPTRRASLADVPPLAWQPDLPDLYPSGLDQVRRLKVARCVYRHAARADLAGHRFHGRFAEGQVWMASFRCSLNAPFS